MRRILAFRLRYRAAIIGLSITVAFLEGVGLGFLLPNGVFVNPVDQAWEDECETH